jgi:GTP1/Obg family GTP-binding protein
MSKEELIEAIKAADVGPFREVRLITLVHHQGVNKDTVERICQELKEVNEEEAQELGRLKEVLQTIEPDVKALKEIKGTLEKIRRAGAREAK